MRTAKRNSIESNIGTEIKFRKPNCKNELKHGIEKTIRNKNEITHGNIKRIQYIKQE